ncbi:MAG: PAS domain S-box protein [Chloroflexota bacterium]|nr:MAG: PAS domain S-box protein [Chloroflexota bacterium]
MADHNQPHEASELEQRLARLTAFREVARAIGASLDLGEICRRALEATLRVFGGEAAALYAANWKDSRLTSIAFSGVAPRYQAKYVTLPLNESSLSGKAALTGTPQIGVVGQLPPLSQEIAAALGTRNYAIIPVFSRGKVLGILNVTVDPTREITAEDVELLSEIAAPIGAAMDNAALYSQTVGLNACLLAADNLLQTLIDNAMEFINYLDAELIVRFASRKTLAILGLSAEDVLGRPIFDVVPWLREHEEGRAIVAAVRLGELQRLKETLVVLPDRASSYWDIEVVPTAEVAGKVRGVVIFALDVTDKVQARQVAEERARREKAVWEVALAVNSESCLNDVLHRAMERMADVLQAAGGVTCLIDPSGQRVRGVSAVGTGIPRLEEIDFDLQDLPISRRALRTRHPVFASADDVSAKIRPILECAGVVQVLCVPLLCDGRSIGLVYVHYTTPRPQPSPEEMGFGMSLGNQCAVAIDKARLLEEAQTQRSRLESVIEWMPDGVAIARAADSRITLINRAASRIFGRELPLGTRLDEVPAVLGLQRPDGSTLRPEEMVLGQSLLYRRPVRGQEIVVTRPDGSKRHLVSSGQPLFDEDGQLREAVVVLQDVTLLKEAQRRAEELKEIAERRADELDAVIENLAEGVTIMDPAGQILYLNRVGRGIWRLPEERARDLGSALPYLETIDLRFPDGRPIPFEQRPIVRALRGETYSDFEVLFYRADGYRMTLLFSCSSIRDQHGRLVLCIIVYRDITRLRELERLREDYMRIVAHDLRAPLTIIQGQAQMALRLVKGGRPAEGLKSMTAVVTSAQRMNGMIQDLVDAVRLESGRLELAVKPVDLVEFIQDLVERMTGMIDVRRLQLDPAPDLPPVLADVNRLERIMTNLLTNALKYSSPESPVTIRIRPRNGEVITSVLDRGVGIASEEIPHMFERFFRGAAGRDAQGLGLGLYITRMLVEAHGGHIWVESPGPGMGSTFSFSVPTAAA